jgi:hypothetical protein
MPQIFAEATYMADLRKGHALRALRRIHLLCRLERVISDCVEDTVARRYNGRKDNGACFHLFGPHFSHFCRQN